MLSRLAHRLERLIDLLHVLYAVDSLDEDHVRAGLGIELRAFNRIVDAVYGGAVGARGD
jgi:hypothetical protein